MNQRPWLADWGATFWYTRISPGTSLNRFIDLWWGIVQLKHVQTLDFMIFQAKNLGFPGKNQAIKPRIRGNFQVQGAHPPVLDSTGLCGRQVQQVLGGYAGEAFRHQHGGWATILPSNPPQESNNPAIHPRNPAGFWRMLLEIFMGMTMTMLRQTGSSTWSKLIANYTMCLFATLDIQRVL